MLYDFINKIILVLETSFYFNFCEEFNNKLYCNIYMYIPVIFIIFVWLIYEMYNFIYNLHIYSVVYAVFEVKSS